MRLAAIVLPTLLSLCLFAQAYSPAKVDFYTGSFHELRKEAFEEDKPYVLFFSFTQDRDSKELEEYTFHEPLLSTYISQNYYIYKVNVGTPHRGDDYLEKDFGVKQSGLLIFDAKSYELERIHGFVEPSALLNTLRKHQPERGYLSQNNTPEEVPSYPDEIIIEDLGPNTAVRKIENEFFISRNPVINPEADRKKEEIQILDLPAESKSFSQRETQTSSQWKREDPFEKISYVGSDEEILNKRFDFEEENTEETNNEYEYDTGLDEDQSRIREVEFQEKDWIEVEKTPAKYTASNHQNSSMIKSEGFGIQTGVFEQSYFMRQEVDFLQSKFRKNVFVNKATLNGREVYKVQIGPFESEAAARSFEKTFRAVTKNRKGMLVYMR